MKVLYFDCFAGISGDMTLGAFLDLGVDPEYLKGELAKLGVPGFHLEIEKTSLRGIGGTKCRVVMDRHEHSHRHFGDIVKIIEDSDLSAVVKTTAIAIFRRVAVAEGKVHGVPEDQVHFHEVGAVDSIVDIVGAAICHHALAPDKTYCTGINVGSGYVKCAHGLLPVPAPATAEILGSTEIRSYSAHIDGESATPTGVAIAAELAEYTPELPAMAAPKIGWGFGDREFEIINGLRLFLGEDGEKDPDDPCGAWVVETNIDDMTGEMAGYVLEGLFELGVRDAFYTPIYMKKNRPAMKLTVICGDHRLAAVEDYLLRETSSIGLRKYQVERVVMDREIRQIETPLGSVAVKFSSLGDIKKAMPEYEDMRALAKKSGKSLLEIQQLVLGALKFKGE
ncbi:MAG: nickel pincer cofactor biosynthesis protein LarC [Eubacterium sp.]|nr:nickel pincer cofactor biosynthesis protein LarC [Eubacterium sp.]